LIELLVSITILGILGAATVRLFVSQSRFVDQSTKQRSARAVSRTSVNVLLAELRGVEATGGVVAATSRQVTVRTPYAMGLACGAAAGRTVVSLLPTDSATLADARFAGYAYREGSGTYRYATSGASVTPSAATAVCDAAGITTLPRGSLVELAPPIVAPFDVGSVVQLHQVIEYAFLPSAVVPGRLGLWRSVQGGAGEELAFPFDSASAFRFLTTGSDTSLTVPPSLLSDIRGLELHFTGASEAPRAGRSAPETAQQRAAVYFLNRPES